MQGPEHDRPVLLPNCKPGDPVDAPGLVHDWKRVTEDDIGAVYYCPRCGQVDLD